MCNSQSNNIIILIKGIVLGNRVKMIACIIALTLTFSNTTTMKSSSKANSVWILLIQIITQKNSHRRMSVKRKYMISKMSFLTPACNACMHSALYKPQTFLFV